MRCSRIFSKSYRNYHFVMFTSILKIDDFHCLIGNENMKYYTLLNPYYNDKPNFQYKLFIGTQQTD